MFGRRKGMLRREMTEGLLDLLNQCKEDWLTKKKVIESSIDPSDEVLHQLKLAEAKYLFLLREVRELKIFVAKK